MSQNLTFVEQINTVYQWQRVKTSHKQNAQCSGNTKTVSKQIRNSVFTASIFAIFIDFALEF